MTPEEIELRKLAAEWITAIRTRITALHNELQRMDNATNPSSPLARVLDGARVSEIRCALEDADCHAAALNLVWDDVPIPDLLAKASELAEVLSPTPSVALVKWLVEPIKSDGQE